MNGDALAWITHHAHTLVWMTILVGLVVLMVFLVAYALNPRYTGERARPAAPPGRHAAPLTGRRERLRTARAMRARLTP